MDTIKRALALILSVTLIVTIGICFNENNVNADSYGLSNPRVSRNVSTWDCVYLGAYPQTSDGKGGFKTEAIKWRVLSVNGNDAFLMSDKALDVKTYKELHAGGVYASTDDDIPKPDPQTWEIYYVRSWLNNEFYNKAFSSTEKNAIKTTTVINSNNKYYGTNGGNNTQDKVYLLSIDEMENKAYGFLEFDSYFGCDLTKVAVATDYAMSKDILEITLGDKYYPGSPKNLCCYWLRTPGEKSFDTSFVYPDGWLNPTGGTGESWYYSKRTDDWSNEFYYGIRPVIHIDLSSSAWRSAGTYKMGVITDAMMAQKNGNNDIKSIQNKVGKISKIKSIKKGFKISWNKMNNIDGYNIQYSLKKNFKKSKTVKIKKATTTSKKIKKLKKKRKYYIRIRGYKKVNSKIVYTKWSKTKTKKTK